MTRLFAVGSADPRDQACERACAEAPVEFCAERCDDWCAAAARVIADWEDDD